MQDILHDIELFAWAGISFGKQEAYLLQKSLKLLAGSSGASSLRFFGKIQGTKSDYYIVEATIEGEAEAAEGEEKDPLTEAAGTGVNRFAYFVTNSPFSKWTKLPDLTPSHLAVSRKIRYILTGDLEKPIY